MRSRAWRVALGIVVVALIAVGLSFVPAQTVPRVSIPVTGAQSVVCPSQEPALLPVTVRATDTGPVTGRAIGATSSGPVTATGVSATAKPYFLSGSQSLAGTSNATSPSGADKGLWLASCSAPSSEQSFVGLIADESHVVTLLITNPDPTEAVVDVAFYGPKGRITTQGSRGLKVLGNSTRPLGLAPLVNGEGPVTAVVEASQGRASTYALVESPKGSDWVTASGGGSTVTTIAGVPGGTGARVLAVTNMSDRRATFGVEVLAANESFAAAGADSVSIEPASTVTVTLDAALRGEVAGLRITATQPVTAALWSTSAEGDLGVSPSRPAFRGSSIIPVTAGGVLVATNPGTEAASLTVTLLDGTSVVESQEVTVNPGTSVQVPMTTGTAAQLTTTSADLRLTTLVTAVNGVTGLGVAAWGPGGPGAIEVTPTLDPNLG
jgi:hypothetical protein